MSGVAEVLVPVVTMAVAASGLHGAGDRGVLASVGAKATRCIEHPKGVHRQRKSNGHVWTTNECVFSRFEILYT